MASLPDDARRARIRALLAEPQRRDGRAAEHVRADRSR